MTKLILIRHANPAIDEQKPAHEWPLSDVGRERSGLMADHLRVFEPDRVVASEEMKAAETGQIVAEILGIPFETMPGLHEHVRPKANWMGREQFEAQVAALFNRPNELVMGAETADEAHERFSTAVQAALERYPNQTLAIATHGTVMTLYIARLTGIEPVAFWKSIGMPAFTVVDLETKKIVTSVNDL
ncbi:MAG: phosphoglycerate mutase family protein [Anaerolineae bacterium]|nr:phosphoglycerate mutase family protein [Anaerolineae bacterium]